MQISTDPDGRVYVRWHPGGPFTVLDPGATVTSESGLGGAQEWSSYDRYPDGWDSGYADGWDDHARDEMRRRAAEKTEKASTL